MDAFIDRIAAAARERGDIPQLTKTNEAKRVLARGGRYQNDAGLRAFVAAQNQEAAGQYALAVISYQEALRSGADDVSPKLIGQKLDAIKAAHPEDYEKGMAKFLDPSAANAIYEALRSLNLPTGVGTRTINSGVTAPAPSPPARTRRK